MIHRMRCWLAASAALLLAVSALAAELPRATPESVGLSSERLGRIQEVLGAGVDRGEIPGYVALVARRGKVVYYQAYGMQDPTTGKPMSRDAIFRIYSMTKPITSVAAMILVEEGKIGLGDPVDKYIPGLADLQVATNVGEVAEPAALQTAPAARSPTILDLFRHTAGFSYAFLAAFQAQAPLEQMYVEDMNDLMITNAEMIPRLKELPLRYQPGTTWWYSHATDVLGRVVENVSGVSLERFFQERVLRPLDMKDTSFAVAPGKASRLAQPFPADREGLILQYTDPDQEVRWHAGGHGLTSTPRDYARFLQMMLNGGELDGTRILGRKTVELMTMDHVGDVIDHGPLWFPGQSHGFGLGFAVRTEGPRAPAALNPMVGSVGEYYWAGYAGTYFWVDPQEELVAVYMMQSVRQLVPYANAFKQAVLQAVVD